MKTPEQICAFIVLYCRDLEFISPKLQRIPSMQNSLWQAPVLPSTERLGLGLWYVIPQGKSWEIVDVFLLMLHRLLWQKHMRHSTRLILWLIWALILQ
ncbi:hypothetical protein V6N13_008325 [Hibiscus sabdariffa]|uniref:Uncharacterized protein n=1 Tax=Hibiscus sabdariffa TaxID=183260 RepID=A0ABR2ECN8_9ROSI